MSELAIGKIDWKRLAKEAEARAEAAEADARRYRWLRDGLEANGDDAYEIVASGYLGGIDAAIDAELAKEGKKEEWW